MEIENSVCFVDVKASDWFFVSYTVDGQQFDD